MIVANRNEVIAKIEFIESQLQDLNHYLPETYDYLLGQLDKQRRILAELDIETSYAAINSNCTK